MGRKPKILMLGWEFPPVINGGLGVACHDLCKALTAYAKVTMIIPKNTGDFKVDNCELIGLNSIDPESLPTLSEEYDKTIFEDVHYIPAGLDPYYSDEEPQTKVHVTSRLEKFNRKIEQEKIPPFEINELYGKDVIEKVTHFGKLAARYAMTREFDIIHVHDWMTMIAGMEIKARTGKPLVVHVHSLEIDRSGEQSPGWVYETEKRGMEVADLVMPVSDFTANIIQKYYGIPAEKIVTIHNGIRPVLPYRTLKPFKEKLVVFVGRLTRQKGPSILIDIAEKVIGHSPNVRFVMAGTGDKSETLIHKSAACRLGNRFHLTGFQKLNNVRHLLSMADAYCMPSVSEPFGLSAVEAVQFGVPCIISKQSGVAEVLLGSMKFDYWDVERAANYIITSIHNDVLRKKIIADAYSDLNHISWELSAKKVIDAYANYNLC